MIEQRDSRILLLKEIINGIIYIIRWLFNVVLKFFKWIWLRLDNRSNTNQE
jgi:hypothetical protein